MNRIDIITKKIDSTEKKLDAAEKKAADAEQVPGHDVDKVMKLEQRVYHLRSLLTEQQREKNLLLSTSIAPLTLSAGELEILRQSIWDGSTQYCEENQTITDAKRHVVFPVEKEARVIFVRPCYPVIFDHFTNTTGPGLILKGPPGIGKSFMSMYFLFEIVKNRGGAVIYENVMRGRTYVLPVNGPCRVHVGPATVENCPELDDSTSVHLFDASAGQHRQPVLNRARVVIFTSPNRESYQQWERIGSKMLTIPSYTIEELSRRREYFPGVTDTAFARRVDLCGSGSIRLVLSLDDDQSEDMVDRAVTSTTVDNMLDIIQNRDVELGGGVHGPSALFTTTLADGASATNVSSYRSTNVIWNISSATIMGRILLKGRENMSHFAARASLVLSTVPGTETTAGFLFEAASPELIAQGGILTVRELRDAKDSSGTAVQALGEDSAQQEFSVLQLVDARNLTTPTDVLQHCQDKKKLYVFLKRMAGFDAFNPPNNYFQITNRNSHPINFAAVETVCSSVADGQVVNLYHVVPAHKFPQWRNAQSFDLGGAERNGAKLQKLTPSELTKFGISKKMVMGVLQKLNQFVVCLDQQAPLRRSQEKRGPGAVGNRAYSTLTPNHVARSLVRFLVRKL
eukprot:gene7825-9333_t